MKFALLLGAAACLVATQVMADDKEDQQWEFGLGVSRSKARDEILGTGWATGGSAMVGWRANRSVAAEASYIHAGHVNGRVMGVPVKFTGKALELAAVGSWWFTESWSIYGRAGILWYDARADVSGGGSVGETGTSAAFGAGIQTMVEGALIRLGYDRSKFDTTTVQQASLQIVWLL